VRPKGSKTRILTDEDRKKILYWYTTFNYSMADIGELLGVDRWRVAKEIRKMIE